jgi:hypothetical protein
VSDNRIFSKDACTVCGRLGDPHAEWCDTTRSWLVQLDPELITRPCTWRGCTAQVRLPALRCPAHAWGRVGHKLSAYSVALIKQAIRAGESQTAVAERFGVTRPTVSRIMHGRIWKQVA